MPDAKTGDTVSVHYTGRLDNGTVFDSSKERDPITFQLGEGKVIPGFEEAVEGMSPGDTKTAKIEPTEAYGERRDELILTVPREKMPDGMEPELGQELSMRTEDGQAIPARIVDLNEETIKLDANHPLAGEELTFEIELVAVA